VTIQYAILGFLSESSMSGYDLKKRFADSDVLYWSGNNNQIYRALVELHQDDWVTVEVQHQEDRPSRKIYTITEKGRAALRQWILSTPDLPQLRHPFHIQLAWADLLSADELDSLLDAYEEEVHTKLLMLREQARRANPAPNRTPRETLLWEAITRNWEMFYEHELQWVGDLRRSLHDLGGLP